MLAKVNHDPKKPEPLDAVADTLRRVVDLAAGMGSMNAARRIGSDVEDLAGMYERCHQRFMDAADAFYEALKQLEGNRSYFLSLHAKLANPSDFEDIGVGPLPKAYPPPPPAGKSN